MNDSKTEKIKASLPNEIRKIYSSVGAKTFEERHVVRGILSSLKRRGIARNIQPGFWSK